MYNKYYRLNESRWELPEENEYFQYPNYGYDKEEYDYIKEKNLKEGWDKHIIKELTKFYNENKDYIVTECDKLYDNNFYYYIDFSYLTPEEKQIIKDITENPKTFIKDRTYEVRKVIRENPDLNPSDILFKSINPKNLITLSANLLCSIKYYAFLNIANTLRLGRKWIIFNGLRILIMSSII